MSCSSRILLTTKNFVMLYDWNSESCQVNQSTELNTDVYMHFAINGRKNNDTNTVQP